MPLSDLFDIKKYNGEIMTDYVIDDEILKELIHHRFNMLRFIHTCPLKAELKKEKEKTLNEFMKAIDWRFNDTEKGRMIIKTIQEIKDNLYKEPDDKEDLQEFPFRSIPRSKS
jgi:hypothetical protein